MLLICYRALSYILWPVLMLWLFLRLYKKRPNADISRWRERLGHSTHARPTGMLLWFHAVSIGEAQAVLPLITQIFKDNPTCHILITANTLGAAEYIAKQQKLPHYQKLIHQFVPYDHPVFVARFLKYWKPTACFITELELWPNLIFLTKKKKRPLILLNARMSKRSFERWSNRLLSGLAEKMLHCFDLILAQDETNAQRFRALGASRIQIPGNLKFTAPSLTADKTKLLQLENTCKKRIRWLAASTHDGEEEIVALAHKQLKVSFPDILSICVPRDPFRGDQITALLRKLELKVSQRSQNESIEPETDIYLADSFGELGLFYRLCPISFIGGSFVPKGGHNPLEAARLGSVTLYGPHTTNFAELTTLLKNKHAGIALENVDDLISQLTMLFSHPEQRAQIQANAQALVESFNDTCRRTYHLIRPFWKSSDA